MDSGRFLLAVILMIGVMLVTNMLFPTRPPANQAPQGDSVAVVIDSSEVAQPPAGGLPPAGTPTLTAADTAAGPATASTTIDTVALQNDVVRLAVTSHGAIVGAQLLEYESHAEGDPEGTLVQLAPEDEPVLLRPRLRFEQDTVDLASLPFRVERDEGADNRAAFVYDDGARSIRIHYTLRPGDYTVDAEIALSGFGDRSPQLLLGLPHTLRVNDPNPAEDERSLAYVVNSPADGIRSVRLDKVDEEGAADGPFAWVAVKNKYFVVALLQAGETALPVTAVVVRPTGQRHSADVTAVMPSTRESRFTFELYAGPQEADRLAAIGRGFGDVNPYGWRLFRPILQPLAHVVTWALVGLRDLLDIGYGWVLILFGVLVRIVLWPLNAHSMRAQLKNMEMQPRIKAIQEKYRGNPEVMQKEMMKLYKEGFKPLAGCLPMLIPLPVLITLFFVFQSTIEFRGVEFLWLPDLSAHDPLYILPLLLGASMFGMQWLMAKSTPDSAQNPQMKMMMYFMPIFMTVLFLRFASGLNLYYVSQNIASLPQQLQIMRERRAWHAGRK